MFDFVTFLCNGNMILTSLMSKNSSDDYPMILIY
jgi:hypothetical protein